MLSLVNVKCFSCSNEAVALVNTCSPISAFGMTEPRPRCEACIANMIGGANIIHLFVAPKDYHEKMKRLVKWKKSGAWVRPETAEKWKNDPI